VAEVGDPGDAADLAGFDAGGGVDAERKDGGSAACVVVLDQPVPSMAVPATPVSQLRHRTLDRALEASIPPLAFAWALSSGMLPPHPIDLKRDCI
jgi:hypothetical protein